MHLLRFRRAYTARRSIKIIKRANVLQNGNRTPEKVEEVRTTRTSNFDHADSICQNYEEDTQRNAILGIIEMPIGSGRAVNSWV